MGRYELELARHEGAQHVSRRAPRRQHAGDRNVGLKYRTHSSEPARARLVLRLHGERLGVVPGEVVVLPQALE